MRTALWISLTVLFIVTVGVSYVMMQPKGTGGTTAIDIAKREPPTSLPTLATTQSGGAGSGDGVWVKVPDEKTGALAWQFRASHYDPQPDNSVICTNPEAQFFYNNGQIITITGTHGRVVIPGNSLSGGDAMRTPSSPPSRGELYDVTVTMAAAANPRHAVLRCRTNNAVFDNDTFRIATDAYQDKTGRTIAADQVPVQVRGDDYDFDGRGLIIRWNDLDRKLQMLEIAHGQELVVKNSSLLPAQPGATTEPGVAKRSSATRPTTRSAPARSTAARSSSRKKAAATEAATQPTTKKATTEPVYHAVFYDGVRVAQAEQSIAIADTMTIDFKGKEQEESDEPAAPAERKGSPATRRTATSAPRPVTRPAAPTQPPLIIRWPGKLVVTPIETNPPMLEPGEINLHLESANRETRLNYTGWNVICATCTYLAGGKGAELTSSHAVPLVVVKDQAGATLYTPHLVYDQVAGRAVLTGKSHALVPLAAATQPTVGNVALHSGELLKTSWTESCVLTLSGPSQNEMTLRKADLLGDVHVDHPKLKMDSHAMQIGFAPTGEDGSKSVQVDQVDADGEVKTTMLDEQGGQRHVDSDHLNVAMAESPDGQWRPSIVTADGNVFSHDDESQLHAGRLIATLAPTTQPGDSPSLQHIVAQQQVVFSANDTSGTADVLTAEAAGDDYDVRLQGQPSASVKSKDATLSGSLITLAPKRQQLGVVGAGTLSGSQQATPGQKATPFVMTWQQGLNFDGVNNLAHATKQIVFVSTSADGTQNTATGDELTLKLADEPTPTAPAIVASTQSSDPLGAGFGQMRSKVVELMTLSGGSRVDSLLNSDAGALIRRMHLEAPAVQVADGGQRMIVPSAGRMLFQDNRAAATQPAATAPATQPLVGGLSGATAFQWQKHLEYDQKNSQARIDGDVVIVHQGNAGATDMFRIEAEHVVTDLEKPAATSQPTDPGSMNKLRRLTAKQSVHVVTRQLQFDAGEISFDPATGLMIAKGEAQNPVTLYDDKGLTSGMFQELWYDTRSGQIIRSFGVQGTFHR